MPLCTDSSKGTVVWINLFGPPFLQHGKVVRPYNVKNTFATFEIDEKIPLAKQCITRFTLPELTQNNIKEDREKHKHALKQNAEFVEHYVAPVITHTFSDAFSRFVLAFIAARPGWGVSEFILCAPPHRGRSR